VLIGSNLTHEQPMLGNWVRKAAFNNAAVYSINPVDFDFHMPLAGRAIVQPHVLPHTLAALAKALTKEKGVMISTDQKAAWEQLVIPQAIALMASELAAPGSKLLLLGALALNHPEAAEMLSWIHLIATALGAPIGCLTEGANAQGAWLMGAVPYRDSTGRVTEPGMSWVEAIAKPRKGYWLFGIDPEEDCAMPATATRALQEADTLVAFSAHLSPWLQAHAEVILPIAPFTENAGTLINCEGRWQGFNACVKPLQDARPGWQVLCVLASLNRAPNLAYDTLPEIQEAIKTQLRQATAAESAKSQGLILPAAPRDQLIRIGYWPMYRVDALCRRAEPLQQVPVSYGALAATLNPATAARYHLRAGQLVNVQQGDAKLELPVLIDASIPDDCVLIPAGFAQTAVLDALFGEIELVST
jgi:NADH-quinone oxidoreductase subunit G